MLFYNFICFIFMVYKINNKKNKKHYERKQISRLLFDNVIIKIEDYIKKLTK